MSSGSEVSGYVLAVSVVLAGAAAARLKNTGEMSRVSKDQPYYTLVATLLYGLSGLSALLYFSWAHLNWRHVAVFVVAGVFLTSGIANAKSKSAVWSVFNVAVVASIACEMYLLLWSTST